LHVLVHVKKTKQTFSCQAKQKPTTAKNIMLIYLLEISVQCICISPY